MFFHRWANFGPLVPVRDSFQPNLGPTWGQLGANLGPLGAYLGPLGGVRKGSKRTQKGVLEQSGLQEASWTPLGANFGRLWGSVLGHLGGFFRASLVHQTYDTSSLSRHMHAQLQKERASRSLYARFMQIVFFASYKCTFPKACSHC